MNLKKVNSLTFSKLAFEQAAINLGSTGTNPSVGCIVEKDGCVLSSATTSIFGRPHAEFQALKNKKFYNANIYVSLEPCSHYGKTPPCTSKIINSGIKKVFFSIKDLDVRTRGKSSQILKKKKITVKSGLLKEYAKFFYKSYFLYKKKKIPLVDAKIAISKDYFTKNKKSKWITNIDSRKRVHLIRSKYDCIISSSKSINDDNSLLSCRIEGLEHKSPTIIIIDRNLTIKKNLKIFENKSKRKIILFTKKNNKNKENFLRLKGVKIFKLDKMENKADYKRILLKISDLGYSRILLESGLSLLNFFIKSKFIYNIFLFHSNVALKRNGFNYIDSSFLKKIKLRNKIKVNLGNDCLYKMRIK